MKIKQNTAKGTSFYKFWGKMVNEMKASGRVGNAVIYETALNQFKKYHSDVPFAQVNFSFLNGFKVFKNGKGVSSNSISNYMRTARAIYNHAINRGVMSGVKYPFKRGLIPKTTVTRKRNVGIEVINKLEAAQLVLGSEKDRARDYFLLGFYFRGMDLIDLANLNDKLLNNGRIDYNRQKSGAFLSVKIYPKAQVILNKYKSKNKYWLPILKGGKITTIALNDKYKTVMRNINRGLRNLCNDLDIKDRITTKVNRHSFATIAKNKGISKDMIKEMLGHQDRSVTDVYLGGYDLKEIDKAHGIVIE